jgi:hypothetical protein
MRRHAVAPGRRPPSTALLLGGLLLAAACSDGGGNPSDAARDRPGDAGGTDGPPKDAGDGRFPADGTCADGPDAGGDRAAAGPLCDGTTAPRLVYLNSGGGPLPPSFSFSGAYGHAFFVIDGTCRYWAGEAYLRGIRTGMLDPRRADAIADELHRADFARLAPYTGRSCPDASTRTLSDGTSHVRCTCDCACNAPAEYTAAFGRVDAIFAELYAQGGPADLPIRVIAIASGQQSTTAPPWPLPWSPAEVAVAADASPPPSSGRLVTDATELMSLRQLRDRSTSSSLGIEVRDAANALFLVLPRDEAPATVTSGLAAAGQ